LCENRSAVVSCGYYRDNISDGAAQNAQLGMKSAKKGQVEGGVGGRGKEDEMGARSKGIRGGVTVRDRERSRVISERANGEERRGGSRSYTGMLRW